MNKYKKDFPIFSNKKELTSFKESILDNKKYYVNKDFDYETCAYLDNAATSMICSDALNSVIEYDLFYRSNVHRGGHYLGDKSTDLYEDSRSVVSDFIGAVVPSEVVFTSGSTDSINLLVNSIKGIFKKGDIVLVSEAEHHSNFIPWKVLANDLGIEVKSIPLSDEGFVDIKSVQVDWSSVKVVSFTYVSNVLGVINDPKDIVKYIKKRVIESKKLNSGDEHVKENYPIIILDAAQAVSRIPINVKKLGIDAMFFSGHKMYGPMGIGVLWINRDIRERVKPYKTGGGMVESVVCNTNDECEIVYKDFPECLESGTPNVSGAVGLASACKYINKVGIDNIRKHEKFLLDYTFKEMDKLGDFEIYGSKNPEDKAGVISFNYKGIPAHDLASILDVEGVAVRSGYHCVMSWHKKKSIAGSVRVSLGIYNDESDIDKFINAVKKAKAIIL